MKTILTTIAALLFLTNCGAETTEEKEKGFEFQPAGIEYQPEEKEVVTEFQKDGDDYALAAEDTKDLPECSTSNDNQQAFVKNIKTLFTCKDDRWLETVEEDSEPAAVVPAEPVTPAVPLPPNQWLDAQTQTYWLIGAIVSEAAFQSIS